ncbi:translation initiation factor IF-2 [Loigolactobacillus backii]|uniref:Translation initiation factor IF-2 n=1 Tax=Loigolactobacillus backii TaxID=375175 RepID=A0A192H1U8_9LACO|nr:translation initiation factor IF-2 [Loigolactobacillus backii]ANK59650.1 translation initiation factor IF-2 [Loigolactobacillus backii]ANK62784.1 translation initiation factor IF-2 [Loigolactobacillus backii]ANK66960.1 translation initiation factor IF-2 [Loigolactobacillus backii]ANK70208.1 translation initiation factor IF-2 [Loigolactobacillus backii]OLF68988.1 translation initiation factor IF-2 [Loigolactobacillus backii]
MAKKRIYELAKELNVESKVILDHAKKTGISVKNHMSTVDDSQEKTLRATFGPKKEEKKPNTQTKSVVTKKPVQPANHEHHSASKPVVRNTQSTQNHQSNQGHTSSQAHHSTTQSQNNNDHRQGQRFNNNRGNQQNNNHGQSNNNHQHNNNHARINANQNVNTQAKSPNRAPINAANPQNVTSGHTTRINNSNRTGVTGGNGNSRNNNRFGGTQNRFGGNNNRGGNRFGGNNRGRFNKKKGRRFNRSSKPQAPATQRKDRALPEVLQYTEGMNVQDIAKLIHREPAEIIKKLFMMGTMVNQNQSLDKDTIEILAADYGIKAEEKVTVDISDLDKFFEDGQTNTEHLENRPPVVTIMGHVDHGKTTLLDKLRHTNVTEGEAGGITQAIGAYQVKSNNRLITFLDTPGHAAFTDMRARGADITDIIVLVVAADDGVMPQTIEAINHAKAAHAPIIVAVNKIDKPNANPDNVMKQLTEYGLIPEDWGGDTIFVPISAKFGKNLDQLLEMILLEADMLELKANPEQKAAGTVIEARLDKGKGAVASLLVQQGTLHIGDPIVVGNTFGRVRIMTSDQGRRVKEATPSTPVEITGLSDVPESADKFVVFADEKTARAAGEERAKRAVLEQRNHTKHVTLDNLFETMQEGQLKEVDVIIKADVQGSVEALANSLQKIEVEGVRVNIIHEAVGAINESDVTLAAASNAVIIGFNVRPTARAKEQADSEDVDVRLHNVIYQAIDEVETAMKGLLEPTYKEKVIGQLEVREIYKVSKVGTIAGFYVTSGLVQRDSGVRLIRDGIVVYDGKIASLKHLKDDVKEVRQGFEGGLMIENYNDVKIGDTIEVYIMEEVPVK